MISKEFLGSKLLWGALPKHLAGETTGEVVAYALQGGYLGIVLAGLVNTLFNHFVGGYRAAFNILTAIAGMLLALLVGWITSVIPAREAAIIDPVQVLRQEK
jgi:ABC-type antimicrobial peptide transport system permease subunit